MLIKSITTESLRSNKWIKQTTNFGKYKGYSIAIDTYRDSNNKILAKRYVIWDKKTQQIFYKNRKSDGKFERLA